MTDISNDPSARGRRSTGGRRGAEPGSENEGLSKRLDRAALTYQKAAKPFIVIVFLIAAILPLFFYLGGARMTVLRLFLLVMFLPLLLRWATGAYRFALPDFLILGYAIWSTVAMMQNHLIGRSLNFAGIQGIETVAAYMMARVYIRNVDGFLYFVKIFLWFLLILLPLAIYESFTRQMPFTILLSKLPGIQLLPNVNYEPRMGLFRAQVVFEHPILFGVFCAVGVSLGWAALEAAGYGKGRRFRWAGVAALGSFFSLSTGALVAMALQIGLFIWDKVTISVEKRWRILMLLTAFFYVVIDMLSNRTPITIFISIATFNSGSAWNRVLIWKYGSAVMWDNPIWGIGLRYWFRPIWMKGSVDNFWLLTAMRYGIPAFLTLGGAFLASAIKTGAMDFSDDPRKAACQKAYIISLVSIALAACTVHVWGNAFFFILFFLGSGVWMFTEQEKVDPRAARAARTEAAKADGGEDASGGRTERAGRSAQRGGSRRRQTRERR